LRFSRKRQDGFAPIFLGFRKHFFVTTCIEKQCTQPLSFMLLTLAEKVQIMDRRRDTPDLNHRQTIVKES